MERRGSALEKERHPHMARQSGTQGWQDAVRRGTIFGCVLAGHLAILMAVLHPSWQMIEPAALQQEDRVLRLSFDPLPKISRLLPIRTATRAPAKTKPAQSALVPPTVNPAAVRQPTNSPPSTATSLIMTAPAVSDELHRSYQPGEFQTALQNAQRTRADHIPGATTPRIGGIQLQVGSSIKGTVHSLAEVSRCTNEQFQLQNSAHQYTPEMIDHTLEMDGCGPHLEHAAADATIDAISHHAIFGN
jgi:hypothetical protein